jgi:hypothetical protein
MKIIQRIGCVATDGNDRPTAEVKIFRAYPTPILAIENSE